MCGLRESIGAYYVNIQLSRARRLISRCEEFDNKSLLLVDVLTRDRCICVLRGVVMYTQKYTHVYKYMCIYI